MKKIYHKVISMILILAVILALPFVFAGESNATGGSCIVEIAEAEVGYSPSGISKYESWYGVQGSWCAIFVAWCANQDGSLGSVIPNTTFADDMAIYYYNIDRYYDPQGSVAPKVGDLAFSGDTSEGDSFLYPSHVGIIVEVNGSTITTVDGNWNGTVARRSFSRYDNSFLGFARPAHTSSYTSLTYGKSSSGHWPICGSCGLENVSATHSHVNSSYGHSTSGHWPKCSICGYANTGATTGHSYGTYAYSDQFHWLICDDCGYSSGDRTVHILETNMQTGVITCAICDYRSNISENTGVEEPETAEE